MKTLSFIFFMAFLLTGLNQGLAAQEQVIELAEFQTDSQPAEIGSTITSGSPTASSWSSTSAEPPPPMIIDDPDAPKPAAEAHKAKQIQKSLKAKIAGFDESIGEQKSALKKSQKEAAKEVKKISELQNELKAKKKKLGKLKKQNSTQSSRNHHLRTKVAQLKSELRKSAGKKRQIASLR